MQNDELIARLQAATGPDRWLDADIHEAATSFNCRRAGPGWPDEDEYVVPAFPGWKVLPAYSASIDAALTLVPADLVNHFLLSISPMSLDMGGRNWKCQVGKHRASAPTPALAIVSAALRARNEGEG